MTREDFTEGRNLAKAAAPPDALFDPEPQPKSAGVKVFQVFRDQLDGCIADLGASA